MLKTPQDFYVKGGLYDQIELTQGDKDELFRLVYSPKTIDCHCIHCHKETVFIQIDNRPIQNTFQPGNKSQVSDGANWHFHILKSSLVQIVEFYCTRNKNHKLFFILLVEKGILQKIGQFPSLKDLNISEIKDYKSILGNEFFKEYSAGIGLYAHGIGIGSFVYLRRIIENFIVKPAYEEAKNSQDWNDNEFQKKRMKERIQALKKWLPDYFVETTPLYGIISKGIHELTEQECLEYFPVVSSILNYILSDLKEIQRKERQKEELQKKLTEIGSRIK